MMGDSVSENNGKPQEESESLQNLGNLIGAGTALEDIVNEHKKKETTDRKRVIYARRPDGGKNPELGYTIDEGEPIDVETACDLKKYAGVVLIDLSRRIGPNKEYISIRLKKCFLMV